ncbi:ABC transporter substrate-binding protein [Paenibacillus eucommiae]|uniref:NitT/TauT family transport system substrate-binding protein/sulfonate transport system substrate-binding protein n=1 Tax=Paenibacillus eucommiae TaxID=1355755 RepID=A0ABS4J5L9_9BACL|nr:ABC transporter substrate-binding protein [Paenibacillus eucommiae]MBP1994406.1 NitT/TauT family transport system substrate-binding protein/sulfonate transport system substrate-binding protein [Paenibacillus eucommiae]
MKSNRIVFQLLLILMIAVLAAACGKTEPKAESSAPPAASPKSTAPAATEPAKSADPYIVRVAYTSGDGKAPIGIESWGLHAGILEEELKPLGVTEVKLVAFNSGPDINQAIISGDIDVALYGDVPAITGKASGVKTTIITLRQVGTNVWLLADKNGPKTIAELKDKTVGVARGTYMERYVIGVLKEAGILDSVKIVNLAPKDAEAALSHGDIAAYAAPVGAGPQFIAKGLVSIDEAANHQGLAGTTVTVAATPFLEKHPDFAAKWNEARQKAYDDANSKLEDFYVYFAGTSGYDLDVVKKSYPFTLFQKNPFPAEGLEAFDNGRLFLLDQKLIKNDVNIDEWLSKDLYKK